MAGSDFLGLWLHILSLTVYGGGTLALILFVMPLARRAATANEQRAILASALRIYDPLMIGALGVLLMSGAINLTSYKDMMRGEFFARMGWLLVWKLSLAFVVFMIGVYVALGLGHRVVSNAQWEPEADPKWLASVSMRIVYASWLNLLLLAVTAWLGLAMGHPTLSS